MDVGVQRNDARVVGAGGASPGLLLVELSNERIPAEIPIESGLRGAGDW